MRGAHIAGSTRRADEDGITIERVALRKGVAFVAVQRAKEL
eukprot:CAMPEP_0194305006 /NCGR_PEP_ID=MMETSP0171-20130528/2547_1 /TAXON_ID=218684 /ORGANISM="Corethron pennatum, Strain L29A3" /LENGTH=40 /DNA_ID= /DNA_START= /DNA_END= /DNA_ORIENTATION=